MIIVCVWCSVYERGMACNVRCAMRNTVERTRQQRGVQTDRRRLAAALGGAPEKQTTENRGNGLDVGDHRGASTLRRASRLCLAAVEHSAEQ